MRSLSDGWSVARKLAAAPVLVGICVSACGTDGSTIDGEESVRSQPTVVENPATSNVETDSSVTVRVEFRPVLQCDPRSPAEPSTTPLPTGQNMLEFPAYSEVCLVGAVAATASILEAGSAEAISDPITGQWLVSVNVSAEQKPVLDELTRECFDAASVCPSRQVAIVTNDVIQTAPRVVRPELPIPLQISGDFTEEAARDLADTINLAALQAS